MVLNMNLLQTILVLHSSKGLQYEVEGFVRGRSREMPKQVKARAAQDEREERAVRKLARSQHALADWIGHARMVVESWAGKTPDQIAADLHCHPQTVRIHVARFNQQGIEGLGVQPGSGRKPRLTEAERSVIVALPSQPPPGRLVTQRDGTMVARDENGSAQWSLDALAQAAKVVGIRVKRSQIRRILLKEGVRWRQTHSWGTPRDKDFVAKERRSSQSPGHYTEPPEGSTTICTDELGPVIPRTFDPAPGWSADGHRIKAPLDYERGPEKTWVYGALRVRDGKVLTRCAASRNSKGYIASLSDIEADNPTGDLFIIDFQPEQSLQLGDAHLAGGASAHSPRLHSDWGMLAQSPGRLVAPLPA
jgi:transposase